MSSLDVIEKKIAENARRAREREALRNPPPVEPPSEIEPEDEETSKEEDIFDTAGGEDEDVKTE